GFGRVYDVAAVLGDEVLAVQRRGQAGRMVDVVEAEATLDAQPVLVGRTCAAVDIEQLVVLDLVGDLAADAAIGTDAVHFAVRPVRQYAGLVEQVRLHERAGRTGLHAFAAADAGAAPHRIVEVEHDLGAVAAIGHADDVVDLDLAAGADAQS